MKGMWDNSLLPLQCSPAKSVRANCLDIMLTSFHSIKVFNQKTSKSY